ncbi:MAG: NAD(P)H-binding protein [Actinomycetota bacterium]
MSVLMVVGRGEAEPAVARRLLGQGDEVRVVVTDASEKPAWVSLGVHVAVGDPTDDDLIERAGQSARTLVLFDGHANDPATVGAATKAASAAGIERLILCAPDVSSEIRRQVEETQKSYVLLSYGRRLSLKGRASVEVISEAVDAADDMSGDPRVAVDLREEGALGLLGGHGE